MFLGFNSLWWEELFITVMIDRLIPINRTQSFINVFIFLIMITKERFLSLVSTSDMIWVLIHVVSLLLCSLLTDPLLQPLDVLELSGVRSIILFDKFYCLHFMVLQSDDMALLLIQLLFNLCLDVVLQRTYHILKVVFLLILIHFSSLFLIKET